MVVCISFAPLYSSPELTAEQTDEVLFGEEVEILDELNGFYKVKTDYGYIGWTEKTNLFENRYDVNSVVTASFADLLITPEYFHSPKMTLPKGAGLKIEKCENKRFCKVVLPNGNELYIHKNHISPINIKKQSENEKRDSIINTAKSYLGVQYRWGGRTHKGIDCSGLCFNAYRFNGIPIWRDAYIEKSESLGKIELSKAKKADLLFFKGHVAMYLGRGDIIHSTASKGGVVIEKLKENDYLKDIFICVGTAF